MENELKTNAVKLSPEEQYQIRKSIVRLSKKGKTNDEIAEILDVSERHVRSVKKQYSEGGRILPVFLPKICILMIFQKQRSYAVFHVSTLKNADFTVIW